MSDARPHFGKRAYAIYCVSCSLLIAMLASCSGDKSHASSASHKLNVTGSQVTTDDEAHQRLIDRVETLMGYGRWAEAAATNQQECELARKLYGETSREVFVSLDMRALIHEYQRNYAAARQARQLQIEVARQLFGSNHWQVRIARVSLDRIDSLEALTDWQFRQWQEADSLFHVAQHFRLEGRFSEAVVNLEKSREIYQHVLPRDSLDNIVCGVHLGGLLGDIGRHEAARELLQSVQPEVEAMYGQLSPLFLSCLHNLAALEIERRDFPAAELIALRNVRLCRDMYGDDHLQTAHAESQLGMIRQNLGEFGSAETLLRHSLDVQRVAPASNPREYAATLNNLGALLQEQGRYEQVAPLFLEAAEVYKRHCGASHPKYAAVLNNLAMLYFSIYDFERAEEYLGQAAEVSQPDASGDLRSSLVELNNRAMLYEAQSDFGRALPLFARVFEIRKATLPESDSDYLLSLNNLGFVQFYLGDYGEAASHFEEALRIRRNVFDKNHPDLALSLNNLANTYGAMGRFAQGEALLREAIDIDRISLGDDHPAYASDLQNLGFHFLRRGDLNGAAHQLEQSLTITRRLIDLAATGQSERQQLLMAQALRRRLDAYLTLVRSGAVAPQDAYDYALLWKGAAFVRQRYLRRSMVGTKPSDDRLTDLRSVTCRLATLAFQTPDWNERESWQTTLRQLRRRKEDLEAELATRGRNQQLPQFDRQPSSTAIRDALPDNSALVDFLEFDSYSGASDGTGPMSVERRLAAFVVRPKSSIIFVDLGNADEVNQVVQQWRKLHAVPSGTASTVDSESSHRLRDVVWQPLAPHLVNAKTVFISPDGQIGGVAFSALPGERSGTFLVEQRKFASIAVPALIPELFSPREPGLERQKRTPKSLLLIGDIDFSASPGSPVGGEHHTSRRAARHGKFAHFSRLPGTKREIELIDRLFHGVFPGEGATLLRGPYATESAFSERAPDHDHVHIATHGFFADEALRSVLGLPNGDRRGATRDRDSDANSRGQPGGFHPGLLSGLALAGANVDTRLPTAQGQVTDDGILTALEVAELDLSKTSTVVLSACESGLGELSSGEGVLGLQRAFQIAGARTTITSLWKVDDVATQVLLTEFYRHLWEDEMSPLDALRQAQLTLLRRYDARRQTLTPNRSASLQTERADPYFWSAFVLSGDWR